MNDQDHIAIPLATFKNIVVTATPAAGGGLDLYCADYIPCTAPDTILNFQLVQPADPALDYQFDMPELSGATDQLGSLTISKSGKMLTMCNEVSAPGTITILLKGHNAKMPSARGEFDPEVVNNPEGGSRLR